MSDEDERVRGIASALDAELDRRNEHYDLDNWSTEEVVRWVLDHAEAGGWRLLPPLGVHKIGEPRPQPIRPSPMMGELGHGRPSLLRWLRERKRPIEDDDSWRDYDHGFRDGYQSALREHREVGRDV